MKNLQKTADSIYAYCIMAMDYDMMGLRFNESSLLSAFTESRYNLQRLTEAEFSTLKRLLETKVLELYERNKVIADQEVSEDAVVKKMRQDDAKQEMAEAEKFLNYLNNKLTFDIVKSMVEGV